MCGPIEIDGINGNVCVKTDCENLNTMCELEGELCDSISWMVFDNGDGVYFDKGDVGVDNEGGAFKYWGLFELEYFDSEANASCDCGAKMLQCEMLMPLDKINSINNKLYFIVGLDDLNSGWYGYSNEIEFDISTCGDTPD